MTENIENIIKDIREKIKNNPKYIHPCSKEFQEDIKRYRFENGNGFISFLKQNGILKNTAEIDREMHDRTLKNARCITEKEYLDKCAKKAGFKDSKDKHNEYEKNRRWNKGISSPYTENEECSLYQGIHAEKIIAKIVLTMIFEYVDEMPVFHPGFDYICKNPRHEFIKKYHMFGLVRDIEYKINVKSSRLKVHSTSDVRYWAFGTKYNNIPDYFLLVGLNDWYNENKKIVLHVWLFRREEIIRGRKFYMRQAFAIYNKPNRLMEFKMFDIIDELEESKRGYND